ncbi:uncharacterized protein LOC131233158 [Magnolia sinica]|uniref:uncharacterized protein LOC131233158 n=1 Tax=Magnolia sinica TaxID=86752 RepID=UPI00265AA942|nr:uncharacterized protein LOC131233158 [Magnolia sinica]
MRIGSKREDQWSVRSQHESNGIPSSHSSPSLHELVNHFYGAINNKDTKALEALISDECRFEELVFYLPFDKKEKVIQFLHELMDAMGPNAKFHTESITEGENYTATAVWHLEWKQWKIPFTNGISFFEWKEKDGKLVIKKVRAMEEFPLKPGDLVLKLLKTVTTVLDRIPEPAAEGILSSSHDSQDSLLSLVLHLLGVDHKGHS